MKSASVAKTNSELKACFSFYITFIIISSGGGGKVVYFFFICLEMMFHPVVILFRMIGFDISTRFLFFRSFLK
jgi:hypothetical protein